jgi:hypothetical protein
MFISLAAELGKNGDVVLNLASAYLVFSTEDIDETWRRGEYGLAILKAAITVERTLFGSLLNALSSNRLNTVRDKVRKKIDDWTLGRYIGWCASLELISGDELRELKRLNDERINIVHERGYIERGKTDPNIKERWKEIKEFAKKFIQTPR